MPMPKPESGEHENAFLQRFMGDKEMRKEFPSQSQRVAVAYKTFREHHSTGVHATKGTERTK